MLLISDPTADMGLSDDEDMSEHESDNESGGDDDDMSENDEGEHADDDIGLRNAAAALCVGAGGFHEPKDAPGLAHFLEHMVFMGSKKYPDENKFDEFLSARNGWSNAYRLGFKQIFVDCRARVVLGQFGTFFGILGGVFNGAI